MTRDEARMILKNIEIIKEYASGRTIENRWDDGEWKYVENPLFVSSHITYRVKPEPRVYWLSIRKSLVTDASLDNMDHHPGYTKFVEVTE